MCPVSALPMAMSGAAWEQIKIALLDSRRGDSGGSDASRAAISASTSAMMAARVVATRWCSWLIVSPRLEGMTCGV